MSRTAEFEDGGRPKLNPADLSFSYDKDTSLHTVEATHNGEPVGSIKWLRKTGVIRNVDVSPQFQRQGVATHLLNQARDVAANTRGVKPPRHSDDRTDAGEAWARSLGERLPRRTNK